MARLIALLLILLAGLSQAADMPAGIPDPDAVIKDPVFSDPVFWWRLTYRPKDVFEPEPYFYWPEAVVTGAPGPFLPAARGRSGIPAAALDTVTAWAESHDSDALIVIHNGVVARERYWRGIAPDELINGRAMTRTVTPLLLGFAVADGKVALDDPIGKFITEWQGDPRGRITVRQLAQNVSGLEVAPSLPVTTVYGNKDLCLTYCGDVVRAAMNYPAVAPPGGLFEVAQENTQLLALVIERAMGVSVQALLSERVWKPIGARDATFQFDRPGGVVRVMCCMRATARDWARLGVLIMQGGRWHDRQIVPREWISTMAAPSARNPNFGLGLWLGTPYTANRTYFEGRPGMVPQREPYVADDVWIMEGGGFRTVFMVPSRGLVILRHGHAAKDWDNAFLVNTIVRALDKR